MLPGIDNSITSLNLYNNNIGAEGASQLAEALKVNTSITNLNLQVNGISSESLSCLRAALEWNRNYQSWLVASARLELLHALDLSLSEAGLVALIAGYTALFCKERDPDQGRQLTIAATRADAVPIVDCGPPRHELKVDALDALDARKRRKLA